MSAPQPLDELRPNRKKRALAGFVAAGMATMVGVPAALAAVWSVNEVSLDLELTDCLTKVGGQDDTDFEGGTSWVIDFDNAATATDADTNAVLLNETLTVKAPAGFRTFSTDTFQLVANTCGYNFEVQIESAATDGFGDPQIANWSGSGLKLFLSEVAAPGDDFGVVTDWVQTPLLVNAAGTVTGPSGTATLTDNSNLVVGFELAADDTVAAAAGELNFQIRFTPIPTP